ncbi:cell division protein FtsZ [Chloroflexota bacterium]
MAKMSFTPTPAKIKALGVGGGGCNALNRMVEAEVQGVDFVAVNTDAQALMANQATTRIQIGEKLTKGLGVGGDPDGGARAAEESREELRKIMEGTDLVFIAAGMGGGTGTGASPIIADLARESGALTIGIVTKPFSFEGLRRQQAAEEGINNLTDKLDAMIVIPNDRLIALSDFKVTVDNAFKMADDVLMTGVRAISEVITVPGLINLDYADVRSIMKDAGPAWLSIGRSSGQNRTVEAAHAAIASPLLEVSIEGAKGVLFVVTGTSNLTLAEVNQAADVISRAVDPEANVIFGVTLDPKMDNEVRLTLIATGFTPSRAVTATRRDDEFRRLIKSLDESEIDTPAFLRRPLTLRRQVSKKP